MGPHPAFSPMAPRFAFRASKLRNIECSVAPRDASYDQLHVTSAAVEGNVVAATIDRFAFAHQIDGGAAIQVKALSETGKEATTTPPLLRGHLNRVNTVDFSPFQSEVLLSGSADATVKVWKLPTDPTVPATTEAVATLSGASSSIVALKHHPSASDVVGAVSLREALLFDLDSGTQITSIPLDNQEDAFSSLAWTYDGSRVVTSSMLQRVRLLDPRSSANAVTQELAAHSGRRRPTSVVWCGRLGLFATTGCDPMQEREIKLWDPRNLVRSVHRERLDTSIGQLYPLYDPDLDLLYVLGKGDRSVRYFEVGQGTMQKLNQTLLPHMTLGGALLPKQACNTSTCEIGCLLSLSANEGGPGSGVCDKLSFTIPRKGAISEFQSDLFPDTLSRRPAITASQWKSGSDSAPLLESVSPTPTVGGKSENFHAFASKRNDTGDTSGQTGKQVTSPPTATSTLSKAKSVSEDTFVSTWSSSSAGWSNPSSQAPSTSNISGWNSKAVAWNASEASSSSMAPSTRPVQWLVPQMSTEEEQTASQDDKQSIPNKTGGEDNLSSGASRFTNGQAQKLKYIKGTQSSRNESLYLDDNVPVSSCIKASDMYLALPLQGAGGPVLVSHVGASGRHYPGTRILNAQKATVGTLDFHTFERPILATGSNDSTIAIWNLDKEDGGPSCVLSGHTRGVRSVTFNPRVSGVLCSTSQDLSIRLWDVEAGVERVCLSGKLEDSVWNVEFSPDGRLLATSSRDRVVRVFDPRAAYGQALVSMGCGFDSIRPQFINWLSSTQLITVGTTGTPRHDTQLRIWDSRNLVDPISTTTLDRAAGDGLPFYDESSRVLFLVGLGGRQIWSYEIVNEAVHTNLSFVAEGLEPISAATMLPKRMCNVRQVELDRFLLLRGRMVERVSFALPRNEKLKQYFQDDVYGQIPSREASLHADEWFSGGEVALKYESLCPDGMTPLSQKPQEKETTIPMSQYFREKWEQEEREKQLKAANLERLQSLAAQPSLHTRYQPAIGGPSGSHVDSDDDWDD